LRRIVEVKYYDKAEQIPVDGDGNLSASPREMAFVADRLQPQRKPHD
jgi:hypothetical protein